MVDMALALAAGLVALTPFVLGLVLAAHALYDRARGGGGGA